MKYKYLKLIINLLIAATIIIPIIILIIWAFTARWPWPHLFPTDYSLRGITELLRQGSALNSVIFSSVLLSFLVAITSTLVALMTARGLAFASKNWQGPMLGLISLPFIIPATVFATGIHQQMIRWGLHNTMTGVVIVHIIYSLPYATYLIYDAYQAIGVKLEEQAWILGAKPRVAFQKITLPLLMPVMAAALSMAFIVSFSQYFLTLMIGGGQVQTLSIVIFPYLQANDRTIASNFSLVFLGITLLVFGVFNGIAKKYQKNYRENQYY